MSATEICDNKIDGGHAVNLSLESAAPRPRLFPLLGSAVLHVAALVLIAQLHWNIEPRFIRFTDTRLLEPAPALVPAAPRTPAPALPPRVVAPRLPVILAKLPEPAPVPELPVPRTLPPPVAQPLPALVRPPPAPAPLAPVFASAQPGASVAVHNPAPRIGAFPAAPPSAAPAPARLQTGGDSFDAVAAGTPQPDSRARSSTAAGFASANVAAGTSSRGAAAATGAFGAVSANENPAPPPAPKPPASAGFGAAAVAEPVRQTTAPRQKPEPLAIEYKPRPVYSEQGRQARIEGDVVLEVLFPASGPLRVLRVVHGLGYGLDQNAIEAAGKIRFRPAQQDGRPVDTVATVRITFQLAY